MIITIEIPDEQIDRVADSFASVYGYQNKIPDPNITDGIVYIDNPQTKRQFAKQQIIEFIKRTVLSNELNEARKLITISDIDVT